MTTSRPPSTSTSRSSPAQTCSPTPAKHPLIWAPMGPAASCRCTGSCGPVSRGCGLVRLVGCGSVEGPGEGMVDFEMGEDRRRRQSGDRGQTACLQGCAQSMGDQRTQSPGRGQKAQWGLNGAGHQGIGGSEEPDCGSQRSLRLRVLLRLPVSDHICFHLPRYPPPRPFFLPFPPKLSLSVNRNEEVLLASTSPASLPSKNTKAKNLKEGAQGLKASTWKAGISL